MHIIFGQATYWTVPLLKVLKFFKFKVFYLSIVEKSVSKKNEIAKKLKKKNIYPLPIELEKKILHKAVSALTISDPDEFSYKKNTKLVPDPILKKYSNLFSIDEKNTKKLRLLIQDFVSVRQRTILNSLVIWSASYPQKKIIYVSFNFKCFYMPNTCHNIFKIIIPVDFLNYFIKIINFEKIFLLFSSFSNKKNEKQNFQELEKKSIAFVPHKGLSYGSLYKKSLYYVDDKNSCLNKHNILHLDYDNFLSPEENLHWVCLRKIKVSSAKIFSKTLLASIKTCYLIRSWSTFLGWLLCIHQYNIYIKYCEAIKKFKNLKIAIIDYDILCPKTLILALEKNNIKTVATQERFIHTFCTSYANVMVGTYYVISEFAANFIKKSKYNDVKNIIPVGSYRSDYLSIYKKEIVPKEISNAKEKGKKILIALGIHSPDYWFESYPSIVLNWSSQINFLEDVISLSQKLNNTFIVVRYKTIDWISNSYFEEIIKKINNYENIIISDNYGESFYSYKLCANADLVIAKHTSLADECLINRIPVLFHEYGHNFTKIISDVFNYLSSELMCYNFEELLKKSESLLFNSSSKLKDDINKLNKTIYYVKEKQDVKKKILMNLENYLIKNNISI